MFGALTSGTAKDGISALESTANAIINIANAIEKLSTMYAKIKPLLKILPSNLVVQGIGNLLTSDGSRAAGGSVMAGGAYRVGEFGPEMFVPSGSGSIRPDNTGGGVVINLNGIVDAESARRSIERLLQNSTRRTGALDFAGSQL
jgi:SLT domain-containing protein